MGFLAVIAVSLLTLTCIVSIFLAAFLRLWSKPPKLEVIIRMPIYIPPVEFNIPPVEFKAIVPENIKIQTQKVLPVQETDKPTDEPIPEDILIYCEQESDQWAQNARKLRARQLKKETGSWDAAFRALQREDVVNEEE